ncbi:MULTISPECIES: ESX secretion-associated protein EspG [unclassified Nocardia]|uniref:ESX secretion-associated protein EspG n=1 Tax=unclassified Nocardia TaxID=2637762 RepID=UPI001CE3BFE7|nr:MULTISPECIES: ESX secretion-associated protein EspG [unclassified Nocardia]
MSVREWDFSPLGFTVLWRAFDRDILPYPLQYRSTHETVAEYEQAWKDEAGQLHARLDDWLYSALGVLTQPEARVEVAGFLGPDKLRAHAAVQRNTAVLLVQEPSGAPDSGGTVHMSIIDAEQVAPRLIALLPAVPPASGPGLEVARRDIEEEDDRPYRVGHRSPKEQAARFFGRPRANVVHIAAYAGPAWDNRPAPSRGFHVMDYPDGRYLVRSGDTLRATPAEAAGLRDNLDRALNATIKGYREEHDPDYRIDA